MYLITVQNGKDRTGNTTITKTAALRYILTMNTYPKTVKHIPLDKETSEPHQCEE
jgi:hypothetical protein